MGPWHLRLDNQQVMEARAAWPVRASSTQPPWCVSAPTPCARYNRSHLDNGRHPRRWTVIFSGLLCGVLALVVIYTNRGGLISPPSTRVLTSTRLPGVVLPLPPPGARAGPSPPLLYFLCNLVLFPLPS